MMSESRNDILMNRIASIEDSREEFAEFEAGATAREWERLARTLRDELQVRGALDAALAVDAHAEIQRAVGRSRETASVFRVQFSMWSGWAAAAVLALALAVTMVLPRTDVPLAPSGASPTHLVSLTADEALEQYLRAAENEGRIIAELPAVLVESYEADDGGLEVFYVRQLLERDRIAHVYNLAEDEHGSFVPVRVDPASLFSTPSSM